MIPFPRRADEIEAIMADPQPGDRFHEMYNFWGYVLEREGDQVTLITASPPCTFPEDGVIEVLLLDEFRRKFSYDGIPGYYVGGGGRGHDVAGWLDRGGNHE